MGKIRRVVALPWPEKILLTKAWLLLGLVRVALWTCRFAWTRRRLARWQRPVPRLVATRAPAERIARLVEIAGHLVPGGRNCLTLSMTLETLLLRRDYPARLEIGVAMKPTRPDRGARLSAHAWVTCGDRILIGGESAADFKPLTPPAS